MKRTLRKIALRMGMRLMDFGIYVCMLGPEVGEPVTDEDRENERKLREHRQRFETALRELRQNT